jgi:uncharacterized membrane protein YgdD (TMEM256/DUF423 family)
MLKNNSRDLSFMSLLLGIVASLLGATGVVLAAASAHAGGNDLARTAAMFLIMHAAVLLGVGAGSQNLRGGHARVLIGFALGLGASLFSADLTARAFLGDRLFPFAAPIGGSLMILSWLALAVAFAHSAINARRS